MASIVGIFTGGTDGARDGMLAGSSNRIVLPHDDTPLKVHYRVVDESTLLDNREDTTTTLSPTCEAGLLACFTVDGTYSATPTANATAAHGGNQPLWLKRDGTPAPDLYDLGIGAESFTTGSRLAAPTLTLTPAATSVTATWTEVSGAVGYEYRYRVNDGEWSAWATDSDRSVVVGSLDSGDEVDFEVYAFDERGTGAVAADSATEPLVWGDDFANGTIDSTLWGVSDDVSGAALAEADGILAPASGRAVTDQYVAWGKVAIPLDSTGTFIVQTKVGNRSGGTNYGTFALRDSITGIAYNNLPGKLSIADYIYNPNDATYPGAPLLRYLNASNTAQLWDATNGQWTTTATTAAANAVLSFSDGDYATWKLEVDAPNERFRLSVSDGETTTTTAWVDLDDLYQDSGELFLQINDSSAALAYPLNWADAKYYDRLV